MTNLFSRLANTPPKPSPRPTGPNKPTPKPQPVPAGFGKRLALRTVAGLAGLTAMATPAAVAHPQRNTQPRIDINIQVGGDRRQNDGGWGNNNSDYDRSCAWPPIWAHHSADHYVGAKEDCTGIRDRNRLRGVLMDDFQRQEAAFCERNSDRCPNQHSWNTKWRKVRSYLNQTRSSF